MEPGDQGTASCWWHHPYYPDYYAPIKHNGAGYAPQVLAHVLNSTTGRTGACTHGFRTLAEKLYMLEIQDVLIMRTYPALIDATRT